MIVAAVGSVDVPGFALKVGFDFLAAHRALGDLGLGEEEVDDLVLVQRRAQLRGGHRILLHILDEAVAVLRLVLRRCLPDQPVHLGLADLDIVGRTDLAQQQPEAHAALGDGAIFGRILVDLGQRSIAVALMAGFVAQLVHDLLELGLDHRRRNLEAVTIGELVEQAALHVRARQRVELLLLLVAEQALQLVEPGQPHRLGELVVDLGRARGLERGHLDVEGRRLALEVGRGIIGREGHVELLLVADLDPDHLLFEAGNQLARAKHHRHALAGAAVERDAIGLADEIDRHLVASGGLGTRLGVLVAGLALRELLQLRVERLVVGLDRQPLELELVDSRLGQVGQRLQLDAHGGVLAGAVILVELDLRLHRRAELLVREQLLHAFLDARVERLRGEVVAVHLLDQVGGHLAGAKAGHADLRRHAFHFLVDPRGNVLRGDGQGVSPLEALVFRLDGLHDAVVYP